jgi:hypothetical protein
MPPHHSPSRQRIAALAGCLSARRFSDRGVDLGQPIGSYPPTSGQSTFAFTVTPRLLVTGLVYSLILGLVGGLLPGLRAARLPVTVGLREL